MTHVLTLFVLLQYNLFMTYLFPSDPVEAYELQSCFRNAHVDLTSSCTFCFNANTLCRSCSITWDPSEI